MALKTLKPNVGRLGLQQNMGQDPKIQSLGSKTKDVGNKVLHGDFVNVSISNSLRTGSHAAVKFLSKEKIPTMANNFPFWSI